LANLAEKFFRFDSQVPVCSRNQQKHSVTASPEDSANTTENQITSLAGKRLVNAKNRCHAVAEGEGAPTPRRQQGRELKQTNLAGNYRPFFSFSGNRLSPDKGWLAYRPVPGAPKITRRDGSCANTPSVVTRPV
jgi:hypothetical protein